MNTGSPQEEQNVQRLSGISQSQWGYYRHWLILVVGVEAVMLVLNTRLFEIYGIIAGLFAVGFLLRCLHVYPGEEEPLILDFSAVVLAVGYACLARWLGESAWRFLLILCSSGIIVPHFIYIAREK